MKHYYRLAGGVRQLPLYFMLVILWLAILTTITAQAQSGAALNFDGVNDYVQSTNNIGITGNATRTVAAWIKTSTNVLQVIADMGTQATGARFTLNVSGGKLRIEINGGGFTGTTTITDGNWHHVAVTFDNSLTTKYQLYVDGMLDASSNITTATINTSASSLRIGNRVDNTGYFTGSIDEVRVWNRRLTGCEVMSSYTCELNTATATGLLAYYKFNQGIANGSNAGVTTLTDASGNGNDGTLLNFALTGTGSNWIEPGGVASGVTCSTAPAVSVSIAATPSLTIASGGSVTLTASGATSYTWSNGSTQNPLILTPVTSTTTLSVTGVTGACSAIASAMVSTADALPVSLLYFNGRATPQGNLLEWKTTQESDNAGFTILRGTNPASLEAIGSLSSQAPHGNANSALTYSFLDTSPLPGLSYYRLQQADFNGTKTLSTLIAIRSDDQTPILFPNPAPLSGVVRVEPPQPFDRYELIDASGKIIQSVQQPGTLSDVSLPLSAAGTYWLRLQNGATKQVYRIVK